MLKRLVDKNARLTVGSNSLGYIRSPLNYIGGKYKLLKQIMPLFPKNINLFVDLFAGGGNVGINATANDIWFNDNLSYLIDMYKAFKINSPQKTINHIETRIKEFNLSLTNEEGYKKLRIFYNTKRNPLDLFVLIAFSFNHQIRFNSSHEYNNPFGKQRSNFNPIMKKNLIAFIQRLQSQQTHFTSVSFHEFDFGKLSKNDLVYCDPPYLITTGTYNDGKRGFDGWSEKEELELLKVLNFLDKKGIRFALSNVLEHKGKSNKVLIEWLKINSHYNTYYLDSNYSNSNYHTKNRDNNPSKEVLITNY